MENDALTLSEGSLPLWRMLLSTACLVAAAFFILSAAIGIWNDGSEHAWGVAAHSLEVIGFSCVSGITLGTVRSVKIVPSEKKIYTYYHFGPFGKTVVSPAPELEYVSVFLQEQQYLINLWYKGNRHYKIAALDQKKQAFDFAGSIAKKLQLDLLDATEKGHSKWTAFQDLNP